MLRVLSVVVFAGLSSTASHAMTVTNGDFSDGLNGWTTEDFIFGGDPINPSFFVQTTGSDPYAQLQSPFATSGTFLARMSQDISITLDNAIFSFDLGLVSQTTDVSDPTSGSTKDNLAVAFELNDQRTFLTNLRADQGLSLFTSNVPGDFSQASAENTALSDRIVIDLSSLVGETISILFQTGAGDDGLITNFGIDNVRFEAAQSEVAAVPIPAPFALLLSAVLGLFGFRYKRKSTS